jgi:hypothetical protein
MYKCNNFLHTGTCPFVFQTPTWCGRTSCS